MGISKASLLGLKIFEPNSIHENDLDLLETLKFEMGDFRKEDSITKDTLKQKFLERVKVVKPKKEIAKKDAQITKLIDEFCQKLGKTLLVKNDETTIFEIKWDKIDEFCNTLRRIERSDERKIRGALYYLWRSGKTSISIKDIMNLVTEFKEKDIPKIIEKILKDEISSGLVAEFDGNVLKINHDVDDRLVWHYLTDEIEEASRRSPGEIEKEILELIDEGSFSATEISEILGIDEATISRTLSKLRKNEKIILSSFGKRGSRYFTTNCDNCPFGTTKPACRKKAISDIIDYFNTCFSVELSAHDFDEIEENQALLKIRRIVSLAKKEKNTKLERSISSGLSKLLGRAVDHSMKIKSKDKGKISVNIDSHISYLPMLFHLGLFKGAEKTRKLLDESMKEVDMSESDKTKIKKIVQEYSKSLSYGSDIEK